METEMEEMMQKSDFPLLFCLLLFVSIAPSPERRTYNICSFPCSHGDDQRYGNGGRREEDACERARWLYTRRASAELTLRAERNKVELFHLLITLCLGPIFTLYTLTAYFHLIIKHYWQHLSLLCDLRGLSPKDTTRHFTRFKRFGFYINAMR